jgi:hypothetical protein
MSDRKRTSTTRQNEIEVEAEITYVSVDEVPADRRRAIVRLRAIYAVVFRNAEATSAAQE